LLVRALECRCVNGPQHTTMLFKPSSPRFRVGSRVADAGYTNHSGLAEQRLAAGYRARIAMLLNATHPLAYYSGIHLFDTAWSCGSRLVTDASAPDSFSTRWCSAAPIAALHWGPPPRAEWQHDRGKSDLVALCTNQACQTEYCTRGGFITSPGAPSTIRVTTLFFFSCDGRGREHSSTLGIPISAMPLDRIVYDPCYLCVNSGFLRLSFFPDSARLQSIPKAPASERQARKELR